MLTTDRLPAALPELTDEELFEARAALAVYTAAPRGSTPRAVDRVMAKLVVAYPASRLSPAEATARLDLYAEQLGDIAADVLMAGAMEAVRTMRFFPSVAELRDFALRQPAVPRLVRQRRLARIVEAHETEQVEPVEYATPDDVAAVLADLRIGRGASARPEPATEIPIAA